MTVVTLYFVRRRPPLDAALWLFGVTLFAALPCTAMIHTVEMLAHRDYSTDVGLLRVYLLVATSAVAAYLMFLYMVYQRLKPASKVERGTHPAGLLSWSRTLWLRRAQPNGPRATLRPTGFSLERSPIRLWNYLDVCREPIGTSTPWLVLAGTGRCHY